MKLDHILHALRVMHANIYSVLNPDQLSFYICFEQIGCWGKRDTLKAYLQQWQCRWILHWCLFGSQPSAGSGFREHVLHCMHYVNVLNTFKSLHWAIHFLSVKCWVLYIYNTTVASLSLGRFLCFPNFSKYYNTFVLRTFYT